MKIMHGTIPTCILELEITNSIYRSQIMLWLVDGHSLIVPHPTVILVYAGSLLPSVLCCKQQLEIVSRTEYISRFN